MCSLQSTSVDNFGKYSHDQLENDFIASLFSQKISSNNHDCPQTTLIHTKNSNQNEFQSNSKWFMENQMDHDYVSRTEPMTLSLSTWDEPRPIQRSANTLDMSTYFSTFDPSASARFQTNQLQVPVMQNKLNSIQNAMDKVHRARINLVPTATGHFKAIIKRKRKRTVFRTDQIEAMEEVFAKKPYVTKEDRKALVDRLQISDKSVKVWFQNRRLKNKRREDISDDENRSSPNLDRLDDVESKIHERTNEFGYVTLDDRIMSDLIKVINDYLCLPNIDIKTKSIKMEVEDIIAVKETKIDMGSLPVYEPISPASTIDYLNEESSLDCQSPVGNEYLQRLIDIESIISN